MKLKYYLSQILPYGLVKYIKERRYFDLEGYNTNKEKNTLSPKIDKFIISVQGFGYSGSGAVIDLLREFEGIQVWGAYEEESQDNLGKEKIIPIEIDFLRLSGGLFELERYIGCKNFFINDAAIKRYITLLNWFINQQNPRSIFKSDKFKSLISEFLDSITDQRINTGKEYQYNPFLKCERETKNNHIYFLKELTLSEYRKICAQFLRNLFSLVPAETLVLDQLLMDGDLNYERNKAYIPNHKIIMVYRDPRDVYATGIIKDINWIPKEGKEFVKWYHRMHSDLVQLPTYPDALSIRFEDLIFEYKDSIEKIENFLEIPAEKHVRKKASFDPGISKRNIGIYKNLPSEYKEDLSIIERKLKSYCFDPA